MRCGKGRTRDLCSVSKDRVLNIRETCVETHDERERERERERDVQIPRVDTEIRDDRSSRATLSTASRLLGLFQKEAEEAVTTRSLTVEGKTIVMHLTGEQAAQTCAAACKAAYAQLFELVVHKVNASLDVFNAQPRRASDRKAFIGILDIFGFEVFDHCTLSLGVSFRLVFAVPIFVAFVGRYSSCRFTRLNFYKLPKPFFKTLDAQATRSSSC